MNEKLEIALTELQNAWAFTPEQIRDIREKMIIYSRDVTLEFCIDMFKK